MTALRSRVPAGPLEGDDLRAKGADSSMVSASERESKAIADRMSSPGSLGLPPLLEARRLELGLIDELFGQSAVYQRVLIWQLPPTELSGGTIGNSGLYVPAKTLSREKEEAPRAIVISAGTDALDILRSHGMDLGHIVTICREAVYGIRVAYVGGRQHRLTIIDVGDICASEDLAIEVAAGRCETFWDTGQESHKLRDPRTGEAWAPEFLYEDRQLKVPGSPKPTDKPRANRRRGDDAKLPSGGRRSPRVKQGY
jgi:hypothetical protein